MITSRTNPKIKLVRSLRLRKEREATGLFVAEGISHVAAALEAEAGVEFVLCAPDLLTSAFARELVARESARGLPCHDVDAATFASVAEKDNPSGLLAVLRQRPVRLSDLSPEMFAWGVALVSPQDPGNIGTVLRTLDAVGASGLLLLEGGADPYHPGAVRASMGALFHLPVASSSFVEFAGWAERHQYAVVGTSARGSVDYRAANYSRPLILLLGSEQKGLSAEQLAACGQTVRLPMHGKVSSLNLAVAAGVLLYAAEAAE